MGRNGNETKLIIHTTRHEVSCPVGARILRIPAFEVEMKTKWSLEIKELLTNTNVTMKECFGNSDLPHLHTRLLLQLQFSDEHVGCGVWIVAPELPSASDSSHSRRMWRHLCYGSMSLALNLLWSSSATVLSIDVSDTSSSCSALAL